VAHIKIDKKRCKGCQLCIAFCPKKNLKVDSELNDAGIFPAVVISEKDCTGCGFCYVVCPDVCITIENEQ